MGRKVHPMGFRIGIIRDWQSKWYDEQNYAANILEDVKLRKAIRDKYTEAGISAVEIERHANKVNVLIHTARPGIVIGRSGQRVEEMRRHLENLVGKKIQVDIREIRQPELDAFLVARSVADQMERRVAYRRAMKQSIFRTLQAGAKGMRIICSGRLGGVEIARRQMMHQGRVPLHTLRADIDYGFTEAHTTMGRIGVKVWIYRGDILPEIKIKPEAVEEALATSETPEGVTETAPAATEPKIETGEKKTRTKKTAETDTASAEVKEKADSAKETVEEKKPASRKKAPVAVEEAEEDKIEKKSAPRKKAAVAVEQSDSSVEEKKPTSRKKAATTASEDETAKPEKKSAAKSKTTTKKAAKETEE